jgi:hypothetical protein
MKNEMFKRDILRTLDPQSVSYSADILNIYDDKPTITLGPMVEDRDESCPPFYISLNIHEKTLHNCLLDSGASHNLMPKAVMDELGLEITKPYHDLFSFDSRKVQCLGMIKDLAVTLTQASMKTMVMDIVVADTSEIRMPSVKSMDEEARWHPPDGSFLCNDSSFRRGEQKTV